MSGSGNASLTGSPPREESMTNLICPNCGASASLPFEMTCDDHRPMPYSLYEQCPCTEGETGGRCPLVQGHCGECFQ